MKPVIITVVSSLGTAYVNVNHIVSFYPNPNGTGTLLILTSGSLLLSMEQPALKALIEKAV